MKDSPKQVQTMTVSPREGIRYGFRLFGWIAVVGFLGGIVSTVGFVIAGGGTGGIGMIVGLILFAIGLLIVLAGYSGLLFKIIADGVAAAQN